MQLRKRWHNRTELSLQWPSRGVWGCSFSDVDPEIGIAGKLYVPRTLKSGISRSSRPCYTPRELLLTRVLGSPHTRCCMPWPQSGNRCRFRLSPGPTGHAPCYAVGWLCTFVDFRNGSLFSYVRPVAEPSTPVHKKLAPYHPRRRRRKLRRAPPCGLRTPSCGPPA